MLNQNSQPPAEVECAIDDVVETVMEIGRVAGRAIAHNRKGPAYAADTAYVQELYERVASRARSAGIAPAELLNLTSDRITARTRTQPIDIAPLLGMQVAA